MDRLHSFPYRPSPLPDAHPRLYFLEATFSLEARGGEQLAYEGFAIALLLLSPGDHGWAVIPLGESHPCENHAFL